MNKNRAAGRQERFSGKRRDHGPLLQAVRDLEARRDQMVPKIKPGSQLVKPLNARQHDYDVAIASKDIVFGTGPAGTGKTYFAARRAAEALKAGLIKQIIVTRPAVEAGESLGFLPGDIDEKTEPYFRPVRDALVKTLGSGHLEYLIRPDVRIIEHRPLAFMRGATFKDCWVIGDEMENATVKQLKLLLTRIGQNAKFIINGDEDQCDLPDVSKSGLMDAVRRLASHSQVGVVAFTDDDIVRSGLCQDIVRAYAKAPPSHERYNALNDDVSGLHRMLGAVANDGEALRA